jgi:hypothetical protein
MQMHTKLSVRLPMLETSPVMTALRQVSSRITFIHKSKHSFSVEMSSGGGGMMERNSSNCSM